MFQDSGFVLVAMSNFHCSFPGLQDTDMLGTTRAIAPSKLQS